MGKALKYTVSIPELDDPRARLRDDKSFTLSIVLTYSENTDQYSLSPPKDLRMKKAPDIRSISPTNFIPIKSAGEVRACVRVYTLFIIFWQCFLYRSYSQIAIKHI